MGSVYKDLPLIGITLQIGLCGSDSLLSCIALKAVPDTKHQTGKSKDHLFDLLDQLLESREPELIIKGDV